jgi:hypothetical protein
MTKDNLTHMLVCVFRFNISISPQHEERVEKHSNKPKTQECNDNISNYSVHSNFNKLVILLKIVIIPINSKISVPMDINNTALCNSKKVPPRNPVRVAETAESMVSNNLKNVNSSLILSLSIKTIFFIQKTIFSTFKFVKQPFFQDTI